MRKKSLLCILLSAILLWLCSCKVPAPVATVSSSLYENTTVMQVKGRQGWQINQVIRYGSYTTSRVRRGWTSGYDVSAFVLRFQKAKEKLSFMQTAADGRQAEVLAVSKFQNTEYELLKGFVGYSLKYKNSFAGTVIPTDSPDNL